MLQDLFDWTLRNASTIAICTFTLAAMWASFWTMDRRLAGVHERVAREADRAREQADRARSYADATEPTIREVAPYGALTSEVCEDVGPLSLDSAAVSGVIRSMR